MIRNVGRRVQEGTILRPPQPSYGSCVSYEPEKVSQATSDTIAWLAILLGQSGEQIIRKNDQTWKVIIDGKTRTMVATRQ